MKKLILLVLSIALFSCQKKDEKKVTDKATSDSTKVCKPEKKFEMYQMSEMAALMEQMYVDNKRLKERIINGDTIGSFPKHFMKIHSAKMTDESDNDLFFKTNAKSFIESQQLIYSDSKNAKEHFNAGVDACLKCHEQKCGGPIPRIKKLYIE
jgi:hypothetical protein